MTPPRAIEVQSVLLKRDWGVARAKLDSLLLELGRPTRYPQVVCWHATGCRYERRCSRSCRDLLERLPY